MKALALTMLGKRMNMSNDGCSNAPDLNFGECCKEHDYYYRNEEFVTGVSRAEADKRLRKCIQCHWKLPILPWVFWSMTRCFGWIPWNKNRMSILPPHDHYKKEK